MAKRAIVTGAAGFIGGHLVRYLRERGYDVAGVDNADADYFGRTDTFTHIDLRNTTSFSIQADAEVYHLAANMGGMGHLASHDERILIDNTRIDSNVFWSAGAYAKRILYTSSACVYPEHLQADGPVSLKETDAYPAAPDTLYGWQKLNSERLLTAYGKQDGKPIRIARLHNVYGPHGAYEGGREKAPAALCRKVAMVALGQADTVDVWGDGEQVRSFCYIDDCVDGLYRLMQSVYGGPVNIGSDQWVTINQLVQLIAEVAGISVVVNHIPGPQGVRGRNSDNTLCKTVLDWEPTTSLATGIEQTYRWIYDQLKAKVAV